MAYEPREEFLSLLDELHHLVDHHGVTETRDLWKSNREQLDAIHADAHRVINTRSIEGTTRWLRSASDEARRCVCCEGAHVFGYKFDLDDPTLSRWHPDKTMDIAEWIARSIVEAPEGARLRFSVEVME
jgi:hypothetical protein